MNQLDPHYVHPRLVALYDLESGWSADRDFYLDLARLEPIDILDLGCGTGLLSSAYAERGHRVIGVDPANEMLELAKKREKGHLVEWVVNRAQDFSSEKRFDLIIMTGHAFQVLLEDADIRQTFAVMRQHLKPDGMIVFETRNPAINWKTRWHRPEFAVLEGSAAEQARKVISVVGDRIAFETYYRFVDQTLISKSELRFLNIAEIETRLTAAGLRVVAMHGDWDGSAFEPASSAELIFKVQLQR